MPLALIYAEGAAMLPEAMGSIDEFTSFFADRALSLGYIIVIGAFFVPHYLACFEKP